MVCQHDDCGEYHGMDLDSSRCKLCEDQHDEHAECCWCGSPKEGRDQEPYSGEN